MKRILVLSLAALIFIACKSPTNETSEDTPETPAAPAKTPNVRIRNSAWQIVKEDVLASKIGKDITSVDGYKNEIAEYNAENTDDQWFLEEGEEVPIEQSPDAPIYIVNSATLVKYYENVVPRTDIVSLREYWRSAIECMADPDTGKLIPCTLYVDNIPPEPPVVVPPEPRLWTAVLDVTAEKVYWSQHFGTEAESMHQYQCNLVQADLYNNSDQDDGIDVPGHVWQAYIGENEATFEEVPE